MSAPKLAIDGGRPVRTDAWPAWPRATAEAEQLLLDALHSGRWTVSGPFTGVEPYERRFAEEFARFHGARHCVPTCHGSSALTIALQALGVGPGSEVIVPGLTWVACASSVAGLGAVPVLVDVDPDTLCIAPDAVVEAITDRTDAIMAVHLFCAVADLDALTSISERYGIPLLEDCSQSHGARWRGRPVGTFGKVAAFSFQQTKLLTAGEGGATLTDDPLLANRMEQLRADGRAYIARPIPGHLDLEEIGAVQGRNYCLSEFHAALLLDGLGRLETENDVRRARARRLRELLETLEGAQAIEPQSQVDADTYYHFCIRIEPVAFGGHDAEWVADAVAAELGLAVEPVDRPLNDNLLYNPLRAVRADPVLHAALDPSRFDLPVAEHARRTCLTIPHRALLGKESDLVDIAEAFSKVGGAVERAGAHSW